MIAEDEEGDGFSIPPQHNKAFSHVHAGRDSGAAHTCEQKGQSEGYL